MRDGLDDIQKLTDTYAGKVNELIEAKEKEILET
jgi:ribosome recycling factor